MYFLAAVAISARSAHLLKMLSIIKNEKVGNIHHRGVKSLVRMAVNLSKLGPVPNFFQNPFCKVCSTSHARSDSNTFLYFEIYTSPGGQRSLDTKHIATKFKFKLCLCESAITLIGCLRQWFAPLRGWSGLC